MKLTRLFNDFFNSEKAGGLVLLFCTILSLVIANSPFRDAYHAVWNFHVGSHTATHWINDGLMAIFFLLIGLELEREVYIGELSEIKASLLPILAAAGGMVVPAAVHIAINYGTPYSDGAGIPMATDIAFALGVLSLAGNRIPAALKVFLTALAVIDDLGAIIVIALFYSEGINWSSLLPALSIFAILLLLNRLKVHNLIPYLIGGVVMWYFMLSSGIHATITGVLLAFAIPFGDGSEDSPSYILQHVLHKPVAFFILPLFALANTDLELSSQVVHTLLTTNSIGILAGLLIGKPLGILSFSYLAMKARLVRMPDDLNWRLMSGAAMLGGIGFTMSIFIALLAFSDESIIEQSKIAILVASAIAGVVGYALVRAGRNRLQPSRD